MKRSWSIVLVIGLVFMVSAAAAATRRVAVFEAAGPKSPPADLLEEIDVTVRRNLVLALPAEGWTTLMAGPVAPGCTGRCAVDRAAEYGADMGLAVRVVIDRGELRVSLDVYSAPDGEVRVSRRIEALSRAVLLRLVGEAATEIAQVLVTNRPAGKTMVLRDAAADSAAVAVEMAKLRGLAGRNSVGMNLVFIEPGQPFRDPPEDQTYVQARALPEPDAPYLVSATEVTQAQWNEILGECPSEFTGDRRPVESVTWIQAVEFCNALSQREGLTPAYNVGETTATWNHDADGYRLPTDAEWEYACRAGSLTMFAAGGRWSDLERTAWFDRNSKDRTHDVATREANLWGLHDMHGNVWEWVWDLYATLPNLSPDNIESPGLGPDRTIRGGSWYTDAAACRTTNFCRIDPGFTCNDLGFRVARTP